MNRFTVEETNLISIYNEGGKAQLTANITAALPFMDADMRELAQRTILKIDALTVEEYAELAAYAADEV
ncbi:MAG: transposon-transfer assisting family protein [Bacteroides sp.]